MGTDKYILDGNGNPKLTESLREWSAWMEKADRIVKKDTIGEANVSTVFLGLDHSFFGEDEPLLYETMIFGGAHDGEMDRYSTKEQALAGHKAFVDKLIIKPECKS